MWFNSTPKLCTPILNQIYIRSTPVKSPTLQQTLMSLLLVFNNDWCFILLFQVHVQWCQFVFKMMVICVIKTFVVNSWVMIRYMFMINNKFCKSIKKWPHTSEIREMITHMGLLVVFNNVFHLPTIAIAVLPTFFQSNGNLSAWVF